jgi:metal-responsive CopG/Arc/MetJ family transcriptional regulator
MVSITVSLTADEITKIKEFIEKRGMKRHQVVKAAIRKGLGLPEQVVSTLA